MTKSALEVAGLSRGQLTQFDEDGFLVIEGVLDDADLTDIRDEYDGILGRIAPELVRNGKLSRPYDELGFEDRYVAMLAEMNDMYDVYQHLDISLPLVEDMSPHAELSCGPAVFRLLTHPRLLDIVESVIGPEIYSNPVQHARIKPPSAMLPSGATDANVARTMWHQDEAVLEADAHGYDMLTVWVAISDATTDNGCLVVVPESHRQQVSLHCPGKIYPAEIYIPEELIAPERVRPVPVGAGGVVLLHRLTEHASLDNSTDGLRWSFDLRYQRPGMPTGRPYFPGFLARSAANPGDVVEGPEDWAALWYQARDQMARGEVGLRLGALWAGNSGHELCA